MRFNDRSIAIRIHEGDAEAFERFIDTFKSRVFSYCLRMVDDYHTAEELTQDTFLKAYRSIGGYDWHKASLSTWLYTICRNNCLNHLRDMKRQPGPIENDNPVRVLTADQYFMLEQKLSLLEALNRLTPEEREMVLLKDYLDLRYHEVGQILGVPTGTVKSRTHTIRAKLRSILISEGNYAH